MEGLPEKDQQEQILSLLNSPTFCLPYIRPKASIAAFDAEFEYEFIAASRNKDTCLLSSAKFNSDTGRYFIQSYQHVNNTPRFQSKTLAFSQEHSIGSSLPKAAFSDKSWFYGIQLPRIEKNLPNQSGPCIVGRLTGWFLVMVMLSKQGQSQFSTAQRIGY